MLPSPCINLLDLALDVQVAIFERIPVRQRYSTLLPVSKSVAPAVHACLASCRLCIEEADADLLGAADRLSASPHLTSLSVELECCMVAGDKDLVLPHKSPLRSAMDAFWKRAAERRVGRKLASLSVNTALVAEQTVDSLLQFMRGLPDLRAVSLGGFAELSDLCALTELRSIEMRDASVTLAELAAALSMPFLEVLRLDSVYVTQCAPWSESEAGDLDAALARAGLREFSLSLIEPIDAPVSSKRRLLGSLFKAPELRVLELRLCEPEETLQIAGHLPPLLEDLAADFRFSEDAVFPASLRSLACRGPELSLLPSRAQLEKLVLLDPLDDSSMRELMRRFAGDGCRRLTHLEFRLPDRLSGGSLLHFRAMLQLTQELLAKIVELDALRVLDVDCTSSIFMCEMILGFFRSPPRYVAATGLVGPLAGLPLQRVRPPPGTPDMINFECATRLQWSALQPWRAERLEHLSTDGWRALSFAAGTFEKLRHLHLVDDGKLGVDVGGAQERRRLIESAARFAPVQTLHVDFMYCDTWALELPGPMANFRLICDWIEALGASRLRLTLSLGVWANLRVYQFKLAMSLLASCECLTALRVDRCPPEDEDGSSSDEESDTDGEESDTDDEDFSSFCLNSCGLSECKGVFSCARFVSVPLNDFNRARILDATEVIEVSEAIEI